MFKSKFMAGLLVWSYLLMNSRRSAMRYLFLQILSPVENMWWRMSIRCAFEPSIFVFVLRSIEACIGACQLLSFLTPQQRKFIKPQTEISLVHYLILSSILLCHFFCLTVECIVLSYNEAVNDCINRLEEHRLSFAIFWSLDF